MKQHNKMLTELFKEYRRISDTFNKFLCQKFTLAHDSPSFSDQAQLKVEKVWIDMVGALIHRNGPGLLERSFDALNEVEVAINDLSKADPEFSRDMMVKKHREFIRLATFKMTNLKAAQPSD